MDGVTLDDAVFLRGLMEDFLSFREQADVLVAHHRRLPAPAPTGYRVVRTPEAPPLPEDPEGLLRRLRLSGPPVDG